MEVKEITCSNCGHKKKIVGDLEEIGNLNFTCPSCGCTKTVRDFLDIKETPKMVYSEKSHAPANASNTDMDSGSMTLISCDDDPTLFNNPATLEEKNTDERKKHKLKVGEQTVGRKDVDGGPDIGIDCSRGVSRKHVHIEVCEENGYFIHKLWVDAGTKNNTKINNEVLEKNKNYKLEKGDTLSLYNLELDILDE